MFGVRGTLTLTLTQPTQPLLKKKKGNSPNLNPSSAHKHNTHLKSHYNWFSITLPTNPIGNPPCGFSPNYGLQSGQTHKLTWVS